MSSIGWQELIIILVIVLVIFGPKRLPEIGRSLGQSIKEFRKSANELQEHLTEKEPKDSAVEKVEKAESTEKTAGTEASEPRSTETKTP